MTHFLKLSLQSLSDVFQVNLCGFLVVVFLSFMRSRITFSFLHVCASTLSIDEK